MPNRENSSLFRNTWLNLLGQGLPLGLAFFVLPVILRGIGPERMGVLTTLWVVMGYFLLLDLGLGRAIIHIVAERQSKGRSHEIPNFVWPAMAIIGAISLVGAVVIALISEPLIRLLLNVPETLSAETRAAFIAAGFSLPLVTSTSCLRGVLEARQRFLQANILQSLSSVTSIMVPLVTIFFTRNLAVMMCAIFAARAILLIIHLICATSIFPELKSAPEFSREALKRMLNFGTWSTVTNVVGPVMVYIDRLIVGATVSSSEIPNYALPHEAVTRLLILPAALARALFPKLSSSTELERKSLSRLALSISTLALFPVALVMVYFADELLKIWLGSAFHASSAEVLKPLAIGYFLNSVAHVPFIRLQSLERPDLTAKVHLCELPVYLLTLYFVVSYFGVRGAAFVWLARVAVDTIVMFVLADRFNSDEKFWRTHSGVFVVTAFMLPALWVHELAPRIALFTSALVMIPTWTWFFWFDRSAKEWILSKMRFIPTRPA